MIDITSWMEHFTRSLKQTFGGRIDFVGLQGSYGRGEATETSDIDVVVILDRLTAEDIQTYRKMLDTLPHRERVCGFLSGKEELTRWEPSDLFQFYYDTTPIMGTLDELPDKIDSAAVKRAIRIGACNLYHGCVHNMLHEKSADLLQGLYKSASFVIQALAFQHTGRYLKSRKELLEAVSPEEQAILNTLTKLKNGAPAEFDLLSERLFNWVKKLI